jgi:hypothetical protein
MSFEITRALAAGRFPLLTDHSWNAANIAGEFQYGLFNLPLLLLDALLWLPSPSVSFFAAARAIVMLTVLACGAFALARHRGLAPPFAALAGACAALNGYTIDWAASAYYPALASFAWIPWLWLALERALEPGAGKRPARFVASALFVYLVVTSGWPFTILMAALVTVAAARSRLEARDVRGLWPAAAAWVVGLMLAAPALLALADYLPQTDRSASLNGFAYRLPLSALPGAVAPYWVTTWREFTLDVPHDAVELRGAVVPLAGVVAGIVLDRRAFVRAHTAPLLLAIVSLFLAIEPAFGPFRYPFRWIILFHLAIALVGADGLARLAAHPSRARLARNPGAWALACVLVTAVVDYAVRDDHEPRLVAPIVWGGALAAAWAVACAIPRAAVTAWAPLAFAWSTMLASTLTTPSHQSTLKWPLLRGVRSAEPFSPDVTYLSLALWEDVTTFHGDVAGWRSHGDGAATELRPGNLPMLAGLHFVNGYSPMRPRGMSRLFELGLHGWMEHERAVDFANRARAEDDVLAVAGIDGLVLGKTLAKIPAPPPPGWHVAARFADGVLLARDTRSPRVRSARSAFTVPHAEQVAARAIAEPGPLEPIVLVDEGQPPGLRAFTPARVADVREAPERATLRVDVPAGDAPALLVFARPFFRGYEATLDGAPIPVTVVNGVQPAVELPPGAHGLLALTYAPRGWPVALGLSAVGIAAIVGALAVARRRTEGAG